MSFLKIHRKGQFFETSSKVGHWHHFTVVTSQSSHFELNRNHFATVLPKLSLILSFKQRVSSNCIKEIMRLPVVITANK